MTKELDGITASLSGDGGGDGGGWRSLKVRASPRTGKVTDGGKENFRDALGSSRKSGPLGVASADEEGPRPPVAVGGALLMSLEGFVGLDRKNFCGSGTLGAGAAIRGSVSIVAGPRPKMSLAYYQKALNLQR